MKDMRLGDKAFFYHSNCKDPGIAGLVEVIDCDSCVSGAYCDRGAIGDSGAYCDSGDSGVCGSDVARV